MYVLLICVWSSVLAAVIFALLHVVPDEVSESFIAVISLPSAPSLPSVPFIPSLPG